MSVGGDMVMMMMMTSHQKNLKVLMALIQIGT
jgi:hypothetical protein